MSNVKRVGRRGNLLDRGWGLGACKRRQTKSKNLNGFFYFSLTCLRALKALKKFIQTNC